MRSIRQFGTLKGFYVFGCGYCILRRPIQRFTHTPPAACFFLKELLSIALLALSMSYVSAAESQCIPMGDEEKETHIAHGFALGQRKIPVFHIEKASQRRAAYLSREIDYGVMYPTSQHRGVFASSNGRGDDAVFSWLFDHRGAYALVEIERQTGKSLEHPLPFRAQGNGPFSSIISSRGNIYTLFKGYLIEFDTRRGCFTYIDRVASDGTHAMSFGEDYRGQIWAATYPNADLVVFDPEKRIRALHENPYRFAWKQYPRSLIIDPNGWVYVAIGFAKSVLLAYEINAGTWQILLEKKTEGVQQISVHQSRSGVPVMLFDDKKMAIKEGRLLPNDSTIELRDTTRTGSQNWTFRHFPSGATLRTIDFRRRLLITEHDGVATTVNFKYSTEGAMITGLCAAENYIMGGTRFPMSTFSIEPGSGELHLTPIGGQPNAFYCLDDHSAVATYPRGNVFLTKANGEAMSEIVGDPAIVARPSAIAISTNRRYIWVSGTPGYGRRGTGALLYKAESPIVAAMEMPAITSRRARIDGRSFSSAAEMADGEWAIATSPDAGTGGEEYSGGAALYVLDLDDGMRTRAVQLAFRAKRIEQLISVGDGNICGIADGRRIFYLSRTDDSAHVTFELEPSEGQPIGAQGVNNLLLKEDGDVIYIFSEGAKIFDCSTGTIKKSTSFTSPVTAAGAYLKGRLFVGRGGRMIGIRL